MTWSVDEDLTHRARNAALDPYHLWAEATRFVDFGDPPPSSIPVLLALSKPAAEFVQFVAANKFDWLQIPSVYAAPPLQLAQTRYCTARIPLQHLDQLRANEALAGWIRRYEFGLPLATRGNAAEHRLELGERTPGAERIDKSAAKQVPVVVGVIDESLAFAHERFREPGGATTRIEYFWNQDPPAGERAGDGQTPADLGYGIELAKPGIDVLMARCTHAGCVDEDEVYRRAGNRQVARSLAHGTHVLSLACGRRADDAAGAPRIVCVQLARSTQLDTSRCSLGVCVLDALRFILARAGQVAMDAGADDAFVIVNFSYAPFAGPHDGSSILEQAMDELAGAWRSSHSGTHLLRIVLPAGNGLQSRCHARFALAPRREQTLQWRIHPDDATPSFMELWLPSFRVEASTPQVVIDIEPPGGMPRTSIEGDGVITLRSADGVICTVVQVDPVLPDRRRLILLAVEPTIAALGVARAVAPAGTWRVTVRNVGADEIHGIDAWIQRDDSPYDNAARGRQSRFDDPAYVRRDAVGREETTDSDDSYIKRAGTLSAIATGLHTSVVGGARGEPGDGASAAAIPARYSAVDADTLGADGTTIRRAKKIEWETSDDSVALSGKLAAGARSGAVEALNGTSVAAPQRTQAIAATAPPGSGGTDKGRKPATTSGRPIVQR